MLETDHVLGDVRSGLGMPGGELRRQVGRDPGAAQHADVGATGGEPFYLGRGLAIELIEQFPSATVGSSSASGSATGDPPSAVSRVMRRTRTRWPTSYCR